MKKQKQMLINKKTVTWVLVGIVIVIGFFVIGSVVEAQLQAPGEVAEVTGLPTSDIRVLIGNIIRGFLGLLGLVFVILILYGGFLYMTSGGVPEKTNKAKKVIINAIIGLIIIVSAYSIASFVIRGLLGPPGAPDFGVGAPGPGGVGGALGGGIIESHYPLRNARNIPRNTSIVVTFKEVMDETTIIEDTNENDIYGDCVGSDCDLINSENIKNQRIRI